MAVWAAGSVLDPFAGTGRVHELRRLQPAVTQTVGVEIEIEWAKQSHGTVVGDALSLPFNAATFDTIVTSPCYGNRLADHHHAQDGSVRHSYTHDLGHELHPHNAGTLHFGESYRRFHTSAWREVIRVLMPGGRLVLNASDFIRDHQRIPVTTFHRVALRGLGLTVTREIPVAKRGLRFGANAAARVDHELVMVFTKGVPPRSKGRRSTKHHRPPKPQLDGQLSIYDVLGA